MLSHRDRNDTRADREPEESDRVYDEARSRPGVSLPLVLFSPVCDVIWVVVKSRIVGLVSAQQPT